jgi:uncharacterized membrane protein YagU involved in acid resistance
MHLAPKLDLLPPLRSIIETLLLMLSPLATMFANEGVELPSSGLAGISHRHIHILMSVIALRIVRYNYVTSWEVNTKGDVIEVALVMVAMPALNRHRSVHNHGEKPH